MPPNPSNPQPSMPPSMRAPPTNNNGKFVVVLLLLGVGIAGLFALKSCTAEQPVAPTPVATASVPAPSATLVVDDLPLPPVVEDAAVATTKSSAAAFNPCDVKSCNGSTTPELESALAFRAKQAHRCYDSALANDSTLQGRMQLQLRVASNGNVCAADVTANDMGTSTVATCVQNWFRSAGHFPSPRGGCVDAKVPISFVPGGH